MAESRPSRVVETRGWPASAQPDTSHVYAHNEILVQAPVDRVWDWLVHAESWPRWYRNSRHVVLPAAQSTLAHNTIFAWTTFGVRLTSQVVTFEAPTRIGWTWWRRGAWGYHAWLLEQEGASTRVVTEESQCGPVPFLFSIVLRRMLLIGHGHWLRQLARNAPTGPAPRQASQS
jgi:Polyketide cyclase / dehydrase and lipid transport